MGLEDGWNMMEICTALTNHSDNTDYLAIEFNMLR